MGFEISNNYKERNSFALVKGVAGSMVLLGTAAVCLSICALAAGAVVLFPVIGIVIGVALIIFGIGMAHRVLQKEQELARREIISRLPVEKKRVSFYGVEAQRKKDPLREEMHKELKEKVQERELRRAEMAEKIKAKKGLHAELLSIRFSLAPALPPLLLRPRGAA